MLSLLGILLGKICIAGSEKIFKASPTYVANEREEEGALSTFPFKFN